MYNKMYVTPHDQIQAKPVQQKFRFMFSQQSAVVKDRKHGKKCEKLYASD